MWQNFNNWSIQMKIWEFTMLVLKLPWKFEFFSPQIKDYFPLESGSLLERKRKNSKPEFQWLQV